MSSWYVVEWHHRRITAELMSGDIGMNVKIAFIQLLPEHSLDKNLEIGKNAWPKFEGAKQDLQEVYDKVRM